MIKLKLVKKCYYTEKKIDIIDINCHCFLSYHNDNYKKQYEKIRQKIQEDIIKIEDIHIIFYD